MSSTDTKSPLSRAKPVARSVFNSAASLRKSLHNKSDAALWRVLGTRPGLNASSADRHVEALMGDQPAVESGTQKGGRLHVRIAFHYVPWRLKYLKETIAAAAALPFDDIDIWVDTNTTQLETERSRIPGTYQIAVWDALDHPFKLTWMHRGEMGKRLGDFDAFMYLEDDIIIPQQAMQRWLLETPRLSPLGYLPGFIRVEENFAGELALADYLAPMPASSVLRIEGRPYLSTPYPYQACWVYDAAQMKELASLPNFLSGAVADPSLHDRDGMPGMREQVALGLQFTAIPQGAPSRVLVPLTDALQVAPDALVFHAPCNYAQRKPPHPSGLGMLKLADLFET